MAGHAQQNGEQLNNLLKTLHGCYLRAQEVGQGPSPALPSAERPPHCPCLCVCLCLSVCEQAGLRSVLCHRAEFVGYFVLFQLGNGGEVAKFLQKLDKALLQVCTNYIHTYMHAWSLVILSVSVSSSSPVRPLQERPISFALSVWAALRTHNYAKVRQQRLVYVCTLMYW